MRRVRHSWCKTLSIASPRLLTGPGILGQSIDTGWAIVHKSVAKAMVQGV